MIWSDFGIVISSRKHGEKYKIVNVFTKDHGKTSGMISISKKNTLSLFSNVYVDFSSKTDSSLGFWKVQNEKQNWIYAINNQANIAACQSICFVLDKVLPHSVCNKNLFDFTSFLASEMYKFNKLEIFNIYAYFELLLLNSIGYGLDIEKCSICGKAEELHYLSPNTGRGASNNCVSDMYLDKLFYMPKSWQDWRSNNFSNTNKDDIKKSLDITGYFIEKHIFQIENYFRNSVIEMMAA